MSQITIGSMEAASQNPKILADKLKETLDEDNKLAGEYFSYLKDNKAGFEDYLRFLEKCVLSQLNEKYEENKEKYGSKKKYDDHRNDLLGLFIDVNNYLWENYLLSDLNLRKQYVEFMNKVDLKVKDSLDKERFLWAKGGFYKPMINKLNTDIDNGKKFLKDYFLYLKESPVRKEEINFGYYLDFLKEVIIPQVNEKYEDKKTKYKSEEEFEEYQSGLFDVLVEVNDYLWENYLFLDRSLRFEYADKVISKINGDCFKRFLYTRKPKKTELETPGDREKRNAYDKVLESFFYRNIRSLILSRGQCNDLFQAFYKNVNKLPDWIDQHIDPSNQDNFSTALSGNFTNLKEKLKSFNWSETLDENNKIAKECLEDIKKINKDVTDPNLFDFYMNFLKEAIIPQINEFSDEEQYVNGLFEILFETNDLIWEILESKSLSEYEKNRLSACYYNTIKKISPEAWENIGKLLNKRKEEAIKQKNKNKAREYNKLVKNFILRNVKNDIMSADQINKMHVVNLIDEETFEEYTSNSIVRKLCALSACKHSEVDINIDDYSAINIRKLDNNKKACLEAICGSFMNGIHWAEADTILALIASGPDNIDFSFSSLRKVDLDSSEEIKKFYFGFYSVYDDLKKNDFTVNISKASLESRKCFMYLGSWIVPFFSENVDFNTVYTELSKRLDFLCSGHYGLPKREITEKQKDKLIIQALVYATNSLFPLSKPELREESIYRTLKMFTGAEKFVDGYKFSLDDMEKILSSTKNSVLNSFGVLKFCKNHRAENVWIFDILRLAKKMNISIGGKRQTGCDVCLKNDRNSRRGFTGHCSMSYKLFDRNDFEIYMSELPENSDGKEFDIWFSFFEGYSISIFNEKHSSDENKKIQKLFIQVVNKIPTGYLSKKKFDSLADYFTQCNTDNAINLTPDEFNKFMSKINKQMDSNDFAEFKRRMIKYFRIDGRKISDQEIEDAYKDVKDVENADFKNINAIEDISEIQETNNNATIDDNHVQDINESEIIDKNINEVESVHKPVYQNINEVDPKDYNLDSSVNDINTKDIKEIGSKEKQQNISSEIEQERQEFESWASDKLKNNFLWYLIMWVFRAWFEHKLDQRLKLLETNSNQQPNNNFLSQSNKTDKKEEEIPNNGNKKEQNK